MKLHDTSLKEGAQTPFPCPLCGTPLIVKKNNSTGEAFLGCGAYRETSCKGGYPLKREHITQILAFNNMEGRTPTAAVKTPESSLPYDPPPPAAEFGGNVIADEDLPKLVHGEYGITTIPQEIVVTVRLDPDFLDLLEKLVYNGINNG